MDAKPSLAARTPDEAQQSERRALRAARAARDCAKTTAAALITYAAGRSTTAPIDRAPTADAGRDVSELRFNELRGEQVVYAIHRQDRTFLPDARALPA